LTLVKDRKREETIPFLPDLGKVLNIRKGNKFSRYFRHVFENKKLRRVLGVNFAAIIVASSTMGTSNADAFTSFEQTNISAPTVFTTEKAARIPLDHKNITQGFKFYHPGVDYDGVTGEPVYPIVDGVIEQIQYSKYAYGNAILVNHGNDITSLYAHLSKIYVDTGQVVTTSQSIGAVGATGYATGDHLHLEVRVSGVPINPLTILP
jgi:murein DD-endopeptidase MepM/ murein hydrolase activator NlpD